MINYKIYIVYGGVNDVNWDMSVLLHGQLYRGGGKQLNVRETERNLRSFLYLAHLYCAPLA